MRTILTHRFAVGFSAVALLGGGAALAAPGSPLTPLDVVPPEETPVVPDVVPTDDDQTEPEESEDVVSGDLGSVEEQEIDEGEVDQEEIVEEDVDQEEDGDRWALGRSDDPEAQQLRVQAFCDALRDELDEDVTTEDDLTDGDEALDDDSSLPPFCTAGLGGSAVAPNAHGQATAAAARDRDRPDDAGPPAWANANRPDDGPPGPPTDVPRGEEDDVEDTADESDGSIESTDADDDGPPPHANARANRDR
jgi:hypothetical protein